MSIRSIEIANLIDAWVTINRNCQNRCHYCYAQDTKFKNDTMQKALFDDIIEICLDLGIKNICLIGGEPTIHKNIIDLVKTIKNAKLNPILITNGRRFSDYSFTEKMYDAGLRLINMSAKATSKEQYIELTQSNGFDEMYKGYFNLKSFGIMPNIVLTFSSKTLPVFQEMILDVLEWKPKKIFIEFGCPIIVDGKLIDQGMPTPDEIANHVEQACSMLKHADIKFFFNYQVPLCLMSKETRRYLIENDKLNIGCQLRSGSGVVFSPKGDVIPCSELTKQVLFKYGTDYSTSDELRQIWTSDRRKNLIESFHFYPSGHCIDCEDWEVCGGGCPIRWFTYDPKDYIKKTN